jgi:hypothetical protein
MCNFGLTGLAAGYVDVVITFRYTSKLPPSWWMRRKDDTTRYTGVGGGYNERRNVGTASTHGAEKPGKPKLHFSAVSVRKRADN